MNPLYAGIGGTVFLWALTVVFIVLRVAGHISWSWWWVFSPTLIPIAIAALSAAAFFALRAWQRRTS